MYRITYPERRVVSNELILAWYTDAIANGEVEDKGACSAEQAAVILHEAGLITLQVLSGEGKQVSDPNPCVDRSSLNRK